MGLAIEGVVVTPLREIASDSGSVMHAIKKSDATFSDFGEAYISTVKRGSIKGWKRHREMICNLVVPSGAVRFTLRDDRDSSSTVGKEESIILSRRDNYARLTIPPGIWFSFEGMEEDENFILNVASIEHMDNESERKPIE